MPLDLQALEGLRTASQTPLELATLRQKREGELKDRAAGLLGAQGLGSPAQQASTAAALPRTKYLLEDVQKDIATDPYTGVAQQAEAADNTERMRQAALAGYGSPQEAAGAGRAMEMSRILAPVQAEQARQAGALAVEKERQAGQINLEKAGYGQLGQFLSSGQVQPGTTISTPRGFTIRTAAPSQMVPAGTGKSIQDQLDKLIQQRNALPAPGTPGAASYMFRELMSGKSLAQTKADLDSQITSLQSQLKGAGPATSAPTPPGAGTGTQADPLRERAIFELSSRGFPTDEANVQEIMRQLRTGVQ